MNNIIALIRNQPASSLVHAAKRKSMRTNNNVRRSGFTLVEIMIVVAIIGLLAMIAIPSLTRARTTAQQKACIVNLNQLAGAKEQWAAEKNKKNGDAVVDAEVNQHLQRVPTCPSGGTYTYNAVGTAPSCSLGATLGHTM